MGVNVPPHPASFLFYIIKYVYNTHGVPSKRRLLTSSFLHPLLREEQRRPPFRLRHVRETHVHDGVFAQYDRVQRERDRLLWNPDARVGTCGDTIHSRPGMTSQGAS